jgi:hypothetical protein
MFSSSAACKGSCDAAIDGCAVEDECAIAARSSGFARTSARSCLLRSPSVAILLGRQHKSYRRFVLQDHWEPLVTGILAVLCIGGLIHPGLLSMREIIRGSSAMCAELLLLLRWWGIPGLATRRRAAPTHFLTAWLRWRCRRSIGIKRLRISKWLVWRICGRVRGHGDWRVERSR